MIPLIKPDLDFDAVAGDIRAILQSGQLTSGRFVAAFERAVADYVGARHAVTTTSATTALHMTLVAMGIGAGDEVLVSDFSFPASGNVVAQTGARPVFVDCLPGRFDMDPEDLERRIGAKSRAIMVIHPFGQPAEMGRIAEIAQRHGIRVVEDAACALGARVDGRMCGALSDAGCFSFHPRKLLTTGEGGMIVTDDAALAERLAVLRTHGGVRDEVGLRFVEIGFNYRMTEIQAALGLEQIGRFEATLAERRRIARRLADRLATLGNEITVPLSAAPEDCTFQSFVVLLGPGHDRNRVVAELRKRGVETTLGTYAMHSHPAYARFGYRAGDLPHSHAAQQRSLTLPLFKGMSAAEMDAVVDGLRQVL